ncbi:MAG: porin [Thiomicrospira sp.]
MKKNILAIAIASAVATPVAFANAPTVYGQFNMAVEFKNEEGNNVVHRNSRVGIKGSEDLGNGLKAVYQAEGTLANSGRNGNWSNTFAFDRNTFAGIAGGFGTVVMGRHDTPLRMIQPNDGFADSLLGGNNRSAFTGLSTSGEDRLDNVLAYISPSFGGVQFAVAGSSATSGAKRTAGTPAVQIDDTDRSSIAGAYSASLSYGSKKEGIYAAAAFTHVDETKLAGVSAKNKRENVRATVQWNKSGLLLNAMYNNVTYGSLVNRDWNEGNAYTFGAAYKVGAFTPRAKVALTQYKARVGAGSTEWKKDAMSYALGVDYALGKNTKVYAEYANLDKHNRAFTTTKKNGERTDSNAFSVGFFHKF